MRASFSLVAAALVLFSALTGRVAAQSGEGDIKAAFVYNFTKFVEWPAEALGPSGSPLRLCALGNPEDPLLTALPRLEGKPVQGHDIKIRLLAPRESLKGCHVVVIGEDEGARPQEILKSVAGQPVLSISAGERFIDAGGMIGLVTAGTKVQFEINLEAAQRANLRLSAQFVNLARNVRK